MKFIVYTSEATEQLEPNDIVKIFLSARANNEKSGVTGALLYRSGTFLQILEGEEKTVDALVGKIRNDPRHSSFQLIFEGSTSEPVFTGWSMAQIPVEAVDPSPAIKACLASERIDETTARQLLSDVLAVVTP